LHYAICILLLNKCDDDDDDDDELMTLEQRQADAALVSYNNFLMFMFCSTVYIIQKP